MNKLIYISLIIFALVSFSACGGDGEKEVVVMTSIAINPIDKDLFIGDTYQLTVAHEPSDITLPKLTWESSDPNVATVSSSGKVTAVADGVVTISVSYGSLSNSIDIVVFKEIIVTKNFIVGTWKANAYGSGQSNLWLSIPSNSIVFQFYSDNTCRIRYENRYLSEKIINSDGTYSLSGNNIKIVLADTEFEWNAIAIFNNYLISRMDFDIIADYRFIKE